MSYINHIHISEVRNLHGIDLSLDKRHVVFTGRNGSGKTSVIEAIRGKLAHFVAEDSQAVPPDLQGVTLQFADSEEDLRNKVNAGEFLIACYTAEREYKAESSKHIERIDLQNSYGIMEKPGLEFVKYLVDLKTKEALYKSNDKAEQAARIVKWFDNFKGILRQIFDDEHLELDFDIETFTFTIRQAGKKPFSFAQLSSGYAAVLDIVTDIIVRMEKHHSGVYDMPGIVLIDEIEAHLHLSLQKNIFLLLTGMFPNIQFIVTTHSPFVLSSAKEALIYDLEKNLCIDTEEGLSNLTYSGIVEGYFDSTELSKDLMQKYEKFQELAKKENFTDDDYEELGTLQTYLDEVPDYLALRIAAGYQKTKLELYARLEDKG